MEQFIIDELESSRDDFRSNDPKFLREILSKLEKKFKDKFDLKDDNNDDDIKCLWYQLIKFSCRIENIQLALLVVAKLKIFQLALILKTKLQAKDDDYNNYQNEYIALTHVKSYFQLNDLIGTNDYDEGKIGKLKIHPKHEHESSTIFSKQELIQFYIDQYKWKEAFECLSISKLNDKQKELNQQIIYYQLAEYHEIDENFDKALTNYKRSHASKNHFVRILLKQHLESSYSEIKAYCFKEKEKELLQKWSKYAFNCGKIEDANEVYDLLNDLASFVKNNLNNLYYEFNNLVEKRIVDKLPDRMKAFLFDVDKNNDLSSIRNFWWSSKRNVDFLISNATALQGDVIASLAQSTIIYKNNSFRSRYLIVTCSIYLCLDEHELLLDMILNSKRKLPFDGNDNSNKLMLACRYYCYESQLMPFLWKFLQNLNNENYYNEKVANDDDDDDDYEINSLKSTTSANISIEPLFDACLNLGLIDEALQLISIEPNMNSMSDKSILDAIKKLKNIIIDKHLQATLDGVDPLIQGRTLDILYKSIQDTSQILSTNVITIVILSINIFLIKFNPLARASLRTAMVTRNKPSFTSESQQQQEGRKQQMFMENLEIMFEKLIEYFKGLNFNASDDLINATNSLVLALKDKLESLTESDIIRESFKELIEQIAGRCMIESQYKSAAMLYSQIEDNISAIKSLMRTGDVDVVINYSLLVRDITVNRLTMNYLKHLKVDGAIIEDFITKSKL